MPANPEAACAQSCVVSLQVCGPLYGTVWGAVCGAGLWRGLWRHVGRSLWTTLKGFFFVLQSISPDRANDQVVGPEGARPKHMRCARKLGFSHAGAMTPQNKHLLQPVARANFPEQTSWKLQTTPQEPQNLTTTPRFKSLQTPIKRNGHGGS